MTYNNSKSKFIKLPYEINLANHINDNFTVNFKPNTATLFRNSGEFTKFIDDDYQRYVTARAINKDVTVDFEEKDFKGRAQGSTDYHNIFTPGNLDEEELLAEEARRRNISVERLRTILEDILLLPRRREREPQLPTEEYERDMMANENVDVKGIRKEGEAKLGEEDMSPKKKRKQAEKKERKARKKEWTKSSSQQQKDMRKSNRAKEAKDELAHEMNVQKEIKKIEAKVAKENQRKEKERLKEEARKEAQQREILINNAKKEKERLKEEARKEAQQRANLTSNKAAASSSSSSRPQPYTFPELNQRGPPNLQLMRDLLEPLYLNGRMSLDDFMFYEQMRGAEGRVPWDGYKGLKGKQKTNARRILNDMYDKYRQQK